MRHAAEDTAGPFAYSASQALTDLLGGARHGRRPVRRRHGAPLPWSWLALLLVLSGLASGLDLYLREPFAGADLPPAWRAYPRLANAVLLPLTSIGSLAIVAGLFVLGARAILGASATLRQIATAVVLGCWSAVLPVLLVIGIGGGLGFGTDIVAIVAGCTTLGYIAPSLAETADVGIGRAVASLLLGPLLLLALVAATLMSLGLVAKVAGFRP